MFYWLFLISVIVTMFFFKKDSRFYLITAFYIFCTGAIMRVIGLNEISEILMRLSYILWILGLFRAFKELN